MKMRLILTLGLVLLISTFASSNECARTGHSKTGCGNAAPEKKESPARQNAEYSTLVINKLLYV